MSFERSMIARALAKSLLLTFVGGVICAIVWLGVSFERYNPLEVKGPLERLNAGMETIRWTIYITAILVTYQVVSVLAYFVTKWFGGVVSTSAKLVKGEDQGVQAAASKVGLLRYLNKWVAVCVTGVVAFGMASVWLFDTSSLVATAAAGGGPRESWRVHVERGLWIGTVLATLVAVEKLFIAFVRSKFRHSAMAERLERSEFKMHVIETLHKSVSPQISISSPRLGTDQRTRRVSQIPEEQALKHEDSSFVISSAKHAKSIAKRIFRQIQRNGVVTVKEIAAYFKPDEAWKAFAAIDKERCGELDEFEFCSAVIEAYRESANLQQMVKDGTAIIDTLDFWFCLIVVFSNTSVYIATYFPSGYSWLAKVASLVFAMAYLLDGTIAEFFTCLIFILVQHPYDVGDTVIIDNQRLRVASLDLFVSTFIRCDTGAIQYCLNKNIAPKSIFNPQRTRYDYDVRRVQVTGDATTMSQLFSVRNTLKTWLMERDPEFTGNVTVAPSIETTDPTGKQLRKPANIKVTIEAQYRVKSEDSHHRQERQRIFAEKVQQCLSETNVRVISAR